MQGDDAPKARLSEDPSRDGVIGLLKDLEIIKDDFRKPRGREGLIAHQKVVSEILTGWQQSKGFGQAKHGFQLTSESMGIDFVGKEWGLGRILLAVEVDTRHFAQGSWAKLCDIRTANRFWVYITKDESTAEQNFADSIGKIRLLFTERGETQATMGDLVAILKSPSKFKVEVVSPSE